ncbi:hypothetical protein FisN_21Lu062, partial [Fistulifera solaris]
MSNYNTPLLQRVAEGNLPVDPASTRADDSGSVGDERITRMRAESSDMDEAVARLADHGSIDSDDSSDEGVLTPAVRSRVRPGNLSSGSARDSASSRPFASTPVPQHSVQSIFEENGGKLEFLWVFSIGICVEGQPLLSLDTDPLKTLCLQLGKRNITPNTAMLRNEVVRRAKILGKPEKPNHWSKTKATKWLEENPVTKTEDVAFLVLQVDKLKRLECGQDADQNEALKGKQWRDRLPFLRLMHCLLDNEVKRLYLERYRHLSRPELDGKDSDVAPPDWKELLSAKWADPSFNPLTKASSVHVSFKHPIALDYELVKDYSHPNPGACEDRLQAMKVAMYHIMKRWEASGAGDCGLMPTTDQDPDMMEINPDPIVVLLNNDAASSASNVASEEQSETMVAIAEQPAQESELVVIQESRDIAELATAPASNTGATTRKWGHVCNYSPTSDNRYSFLKKNDPPYLLYFWELLDENGLLSTTLQMISSRVASSHGRMDLTPLDSLTASRASKSSSAEVMVSDCFEKLISVIQTTEEEKWVQKRQLIAQEREEKKQRYDQEKKDREEADRVQFEREKLLQERSADLNRKAALDDKIIVLEKKSIIWNGNWKRLLTKRKMQSKMRYW